jgi:hypothetical protein
MPRFTVPALLAKLRVVQAHELHEDGALPKPALELLAEGVKAVTIDVSTLLPS